MNTTFKKTASVILAFTLLAGGSALTGSTVPDIFNSTSITASAALSLSGTSYQLHATPSTTLKNGSNGDSVKWLQCALNKLGMASPALTVDGAFGANTTAAVKKFQRKYMGASEVDGIFGTKSLNAMKKALGITTAYPSGISKTDYIRICNCVAHEAKSNNISMYEKALVVEVIMNRKSSGSFPSTVYKVITQPNQFSGSSSYAGLTKFSNEVTTGVKEAVTYYFNHKSTFNESYLYFRGNGSYNFFSKTYRGTYRRPGGSGSIVV